MTSPCANSAAPVRGPARSCVPPVLRSLVSPDDKPVKLLRKRLDAAAVEAHLRDLAARASEVEIRVKTAAAGYSDAANDALDVLGRRLVAGVLVAVQIRYFADGQWWTDTLMRAGDDFRLVRMQG